jgi:hypothetical protein
MDMKTSYDCILRHKFTGCVHGTWVSLWNDFDYSDPQTKQIGRLASGTKAKIIRRQSPGVLVEIDSLYNFYYGNQHWVCEWDLDESSQEED